MSENLRFLTGKLAKKSLHKVLAEIQASSSQAPDFRYRVAQVGISVAALMSPELIVRRLPEAGDANKIVLPGKRSRQLHRADKVNGYVLDAALAHRELELVEVRDDATRPELYFRVAHEVNHLPFRGFERAQAAVVELAVLVSRLHMLPMEKIEAELAYLSIAIKKSRCVSGWQLIGLHLA